MKCTWLGCEADAEHEKINMFDGRRWANLCEKHDAEFEEAGHRMFIEEGPSAYERLNNIMELRKLAKGGGWLTRLLARWNRYEREG